MSERSFTLKMPKTASSCAVFSSPHSGADYPTDLLTSTRLDHLAIRSSEDTFVDELFASAPEFGAPLLAATAPRAYVDLNRADTEMDPAMVMGVKTHGISPSIAAGLGVIPRVVGGGRAIRSGKITRQDAQNRLDRFYYPYHRQLAALLQQKRDKFGMAVLFDCHSMPAEALNAVSGRKPDIILGDRFGMSCDRWIVEMVERIFNDAGFGVARNMPFAGGYITRNYGRPVKGFHAVQIEIARSIYMNEQQVTKNAVFVEIQKTLRVVTQSLAHIGPMQTRLAAE